MPGRNKTGPQGQGPATGRGMGVCANRNPDAGMGRSGGMGRGGGGMGRGGGGMGRGGGGGMGRGGGGMGRGGGGMGRGGGGMGRGTGGGRGRGRGAPMGPDPAEAGGGFVDAPLREESDELTGLRAEASHLKELLKNIEQRLSKFKTPENER